MSIVMNRESVAKERIWATEDILDESSLPQIFEDIKAGCEEIKKFKNNLNVYNAIDCLLTRSKIFYKIEKAYSYIALKSDEDKSNAKYNELQDKIEVLVVDFSTASSFIEPTLATFKNSDLIKMRDSEKYDYFSMYIDSIIRNKKHLLSEKEEALLSGVAGFSGDFHSIFTMFDNVDINMGEIELDGQKHKMSHGLFSLCLQNKDVNVRREAYEKVYTGYKSMINTVAATYVGNVKKDYFYAKARKFGSCMEQALYGENIPKKVYDNLIEAVKKYTPKMHEYVAYRKKALKLPELHMYDMYVSTVEDIEWDKADYDDAYALVCEALAPLGKEYVDLMWQAKNSRWIDVEETPNKRSGAYSAGVYGTHPFVLLNHKGTTHDTFTIAHEMGHALHSYYANEAQCYEKADYCIFVAEIASTVNEVLLIKHLLKTAEGDMRKYLLSYYIDMIRTTLFRQTMFAEFEKFAHEVIENGEPLSYEKMNKYYGQLNAEYYGDSVVTDDFITYEWARIPHFYRSFYVYKYATGITCAINIVNNILKDPSYVDKYKKFLQCGGSQYPMDNLAIVGIDLTKKTPFYTAMREFADVLKELKKIK
ncbi:MAG: oligoendopeptidase F [Clostridia bacterium]|nr:oligoendopeptidase F [Clostridia bacterium]